MSGQVPSTVPKCTKKVAKDYLKCRTRNFVGVDAESV